MHTWLFLYQARRKFPCTSPSWRLKCITAFVLNGFFELNIIWIDKVDTPLNFLASSSFCFSIEHSCVSLRWAALDIFDHVSEHEWSGLNDVRIFVSRHRTMYARRKSYSFQFVNCVNPVRNFWQICLHQMFQ